MLPNPVLAAIAVASTIGAVVWGRSSLRLLRAARRAEAAVAAGSGAGKESAQLLRSAFQKELHTTVLYALVAATNLIASLADGFAFDVPRLLVLLPVGYSVAFSGRLLKDAQALEDRSRLDRRIEEILAQEQLAPARWADRLAPEDLPHIEGLEIGHVYQSGEGAMAGDFYDLFPTGASRVAAVIGDVAGHGIEPSITAFQVKYLLRVFLRQYRDPAQAFEELNKLMSAGSRPEDLVSMCAVVFDSEASTLRIASAGHPAAWIWHDGEVRGLRATGPLLTLDPDADYHSREVSLDPGDLLLLYTDGLAEARAGGQLFGEDRIAGILRRDPGADVHALCKTLLEAARDFATGPLSDDVAILAVRRT
ncbi:MAG: serine/threonine-protein phosphatase [Actinobacteria bacterium]|nr:serine/threonine-protein phosphatase [Actinomycetota bacterium]